MPKLPNQTITAKAEDGTTYNETVAASLGADGDFRVLCPPELQEICEKFTQKPGESWGWFQSPGKFGKQYPYFIESKMLATCMRVLERAASEHLLCEKKVERLILYSLDLSCSFWRNDDGEIFPSGHASSRQVQGRWYELQATQQRFAAHNPIGSSYKIGLAARAWNRISFIRPSGTTTKWEYLTPPEGHLGYETPLQKLQSFCSISIGPKSENLHMMPYTDAAALWFHDTMLALFRMAYGMDTFFANPDNLLAIQEGTASRLMAPPPQTRRQFQLQTPRE